MPRLNPNNQINLVDTYNHPRRGQAIVVINLSGAVNEATLVTLRRPNWRASFFGLAEHCHYLVINLVNVDEIDPRVVQCLEDLAVRFHELKGHADAFTPLLVKAESYPVLACEEINRCLKNGTFACYFTLKETLDALYGGS